MLWMEWIQSPQAWIGLATLSLLELLAEGFQQHMSKGCIYFAMCFSLAVEVINIRVRTKSP